MSPVLVCVRLIVHGLVQGVGFRAATLREANRLGDLKGHVRNRSDGTVEILAQGPSTKVAALIAWANRGPPGSQVDDVIEDPAPIDQTLPDFVIG